MVPNRIDPDLWKSDGSVLLQAERLTQVPKEVAPGWRPRRLCQRGSQAGWRARLFWVWRATWSVETRIRRGRSSS